jgi:hypothetical protein
VQITHFKSDTIADATGTVTFWNGTTTGSAAATDLVRPGDWNSVHALAFTLTGNTTLSSTGSGSAIPFAGSGGVALGFSAGTLIFSGIGNATVSTYVPYFPASTSSQNTKVHRNILPLHVVRLKVQQGISMAAVLHHVHVRLLQLFLQLFIHHILQLLLLQHFLLQILLKNKS